MMGPSTGPASYALGVARVVRVDYTSHEVVLQIIAGENDLYQRTAVPLVYPGAGARLFMGSMPEPGDVCVVGWLATSNKTPIVLGWVPISAQAGLEWLPVQDFLPTEADFNPKRQSQYEGIYTRRRFKMKPMRSGEILLSSSHGSDITLNEGIRLSNRRLSEIWLRDQDQALVTRSLAQFHALGGARIYGGPVQRDARLLPFRVLQDGVEWDAAVQTDGSEPLPSYSLPTNDSNKYRPHPVFEKSDPSRPFFDSGLEVDDNLDPYSLLSRGLWIGSDGFLEDPSSTRSDVEYGGKPLYRVAQNLNAEDTSKPLNGAAGGDTLSEYRIEVHHTTDGTLPVTEHTEGVDIDRLPTTSAQESSLDVPRPTVEFVLGSVVGNQPFSRQEKANYGLPLRPQIFDGSTVDPRFESGLGVEIGKHAATLLRITNPLTDPSLNPPAFASFTKEGAFRAYVTGPEEENSVEAALTGGLRLSAGGPIQLQGKALLLDIREGDPLGNYAFRVQSQTGAVHLSAGGPNTADSFSARGSNAPINEQQSPALKLEAPTSNAWMTAGRSVKIAAGNTIFLGDSQEIAVSAKQTYRMVTDKYVTQCNTVDRTVQGKESTLFVGPKGGLPTNGPTREVSFGGTPATGQTGGVVDKVTYEFGDREEKFKFGNHTTDIVVGDLTYKTGQGTFKIQAGLNKLEVSSTQGIQGSTTVGPVKFQAVTTASFQGTTSVTVKSSGLARLSGSSVILGGSGGTGGIVNGSDIDPLTNLPLSVLGLGSQGHLLGPSI